jgi:hypothetical protein
MGERWHVFLSHAKADGEWVRVLAENLHQLDVDVFFDEWTIAPGDVVVHELDEGLRDSLAGALVVSPVALERPWVRAEYAAMMTRAVQEGFRLIPVLLKDAELPPLLASRSWVDFRTADGPKYFTKVKELAALLKGERKGSPPRTGVLKPPPGTGFRPEGTIRRGLTISRERATLQGDGVLVQERVGGADHGLETAVWELGRARRQCWGRHGMPEGQRKGWPSWRPSWPASAWTWPTPSFPRPSRPSLPRTWRRPNASGARWSWRCTSRTRWPVCPGRRCGFRHTPCR